jgi:pimeloyl-ACP methyl ester carboxylesterase
MRLSSLVLVTLTLAAAAALTAPGRGGAAQRPPGKAKEQEVTFETSDGVELHGVFYRSPKGRGAACVLLLHDVGEDSGQDEYVELARKLQQAGQAVLTFDFRGHGKSTTVDERFWRVPINQHRVRGYRPAAPRKRVAFKDFTPDYYPTLANDVSAARAFLDEQNDLGECNTMNVVVVGFGEGATVGALWLAAECCRYQVTGKLKLRLEPDPEAESVRCAAWVDLSPTLARRRVPVVDWVREAGRDREVPTWLMYSKDDRAASELAAKCLSALKAKKADLPRTGATAVEDGEGGRGGLVPVYVKNVLKAEAKVGWEKQDYEGQTFAWSAAGRGGSQVMVAKLEGAKSLGMIPLEWFGVR